MRDLLIGRTPKDFDVATSATPNEVRALFRNCRIIGRRFRLAHVFFGPKIIETSTFRANPREDEDVDDDLLIRRDNVFGSETEDARRRDFTINGLFYDVEAEEVIDHVRGLDDLGARMVRTIGDPDIRFREDPVRILRAIKFAARLDFTIEPATYAALLRQRGEISKCAAPRVVEEVYRLLRGGAARRSIELLVETGVLDVLSPHLASLYAAPVDGDDDDGDDEDADERELDDEERAWHRVWDDHRARQQRRHAPRLTFLPDAAELGRRRELAWATLDQVDAAVKAGHELSNALVLGALLAPFAADTIVAAATRPGEANQVILDLGQPVVDQLRVARRDAERTRYALFGLRRVAAARARNLPIDAGGRDSLEDAVELADLLAAAQGGASPVEAADDADDADGDDEPKKKRRRRRGGRRRNGDAVVAAAS